jgi:heme exporter protein A
MSVPNAPNTLTATGVACTRGDRRLFSDLNFSLSGGQLLQVSGKNGSGKTSLLRMVCGLLETAAGRIAWNDSAIRALGDDYAREIAYVGHLNAVKDDLRVAENLRFAIEVAKGVVEEGAIGEALLEFDFGGMEDLPCKFLSQGQKRRLALARLRLSEDRALWILDEPFSALDAGGIETVRSVLADHLKRGGLALLTTHQEVPVQAGSVHRIELGA